MLWRRLKPELTRWDPYLIANPQKPQAYVRGIV